MNSSLCVASVFTGMPQGMSQRCKCCLLFHVDIQWVACSEGSFKCPKLQIFIPFHWLGSVVTHFSKNDCIKEVGIVELLHISLGKWAYGWARFWWCHRHRQRRRVNMEFIVPHWGWSAWGERESLEWTMLAQTKVLQVHSDWCKQGLPFFLKNWTSKQMSHLFYLKSSFSVAVIVSICVHVTKKCRRWTFYLQNFSLHLLFSCLCNK